MRFFDFGGFTALGREPFFLRPWTEADTQDLLDLGWRFEACYRGPDVWAAAIRRPPRGPGLPGDVAYSLGRLELLRRPGSDDALFILMKQDHYVGECFGLVLVEDYVELVG